MVRNFVRAMPLGLLLLGACAMGDETAANNPDNYYNNTASSVGYKALNSGDYDTAAKYFDVAHRDNPGDTFYQLNLAAALQRQGKMDQAEPLYRAAMVTGDQIRPVATTTDWARGFDVDEIACKNLEMGLRPAPSAASAKSCQTVAVAAVAPAPAFVPVAAPTRPVPVLSENVYFDHDSATLSADARRIIAKTANDGRSDATLHVRLTGKTDLSGTSSYNEQLSDDRANAVKNALLQQGMPSQRVTVGWVGETQPPIATADGVREPRNRLVEIYYTDVRPGPMSSR